MTLPPSHERRKLLEVSSGPANEKDFIVTIKKEYPWKNDNLHVTLRYVPEALLLAPDSLNTYATCFQTQDLSLEALAAMIVEDMNNALVPYWIHVCLSLESDGIEHVAVVEDRQPKWDNPRLLSRLESI